MKKYEVKITEERVEKHYEGELSMFQSGMPKRYFFIGVFTFNTGSVIRVVLTKARIAFEALDTIEPTYDERQKAQDEAFEEYNHLTEVLLSPKYSHHRSRNYGITIYHRDSDSPTGVRSVGGASSEMAIRYIKANSCGLSATSKL